MIFTSNKLEATIPAGASEMETYELLEDLFSNEDINTNTSNENYKIRTKSWDSDGNNKESFRCQLYHHMVAYQYLCESDIDGIKLYNKPLTVDMILKTHKLLMENAVNCNGKPICNGEIRKHPVYADNYVYMHHEDVPAEVTRIVNDFNIAVQNKCDPIKIAADLFYDLITAHPFEDGNGRLCRLIAAYAFLATGTPFAVPISSGHRKSRNHYMKAILKARRINSDRKLLYTLFVNSLELAWSNCIHYCKV
mmetsp:Transcript_25159/g.22887  ORF Transcript_25159/g.22887 Transcript_25159/m.22887 type:complete len:251 (+) Transcript_25159:186-938(+)